MHGTEHFYSKHVKKEGDAPFLGCDTFSQVPNCLHPSPEGGTTLTKDHPAILRIYDVGIWDSPHSKFEPILLGCFGEKIVFVFFGLFWCFWGSFSLSRAVSACFWPCICHQPTPDICLTHSDTILTLPDTLRHHANTAIHPQTPSRHPSDTPLHATTGRKSNI